MSCERHAFDRLCLRYLGSGIRFFSTCFSFVRLFFLCEYVHALKEIRRLKGVVLKKIINKYCLFCFFYTVFVCLLLFVAIVFAIYNSSMLYALNSLKFMYVCVCKCVRLCARARACVCVLRGIGGGGGGEFCLISDWTDNMYSRRNTIPQSLHTRGHSSSFHHLSDDAKCGVVQITHADGSYQIYKRNEWVFCFVFCFTYLSFLLYF